MLLLSYLLAVLKCYQQASGFASQQVQLDSRFHLRQLPLLRQINLPHLRYELLWCLFALLPLGGACWGAVAAYLEELLMKSSRLSAREGHTKDTSYTQEVFQVELYLK